MIPSAARDLAQQRPVVSAPEDGRRPTPFDYAFRFELTGQPGKVTNQIVTISVEASFTAVSIGYGVIPKVQPIIFGPPPRFVIGRGPILQSLSSITVQSIIDALDLQLRSTSQTLSGETGAEAVLRNGIKLNPDLAEFALQNSGNQVLSADIASRLFQVVGSPSELIQFKYALFDEASGREFQSEPILNIAGLGSANGERPFRYFAQPIVLKPRSTIRMEVTEVSDFKGDLHVSLHGYKLLGAPNSPTAVTRRTRRR